LLISFLKPVLAVAALVFFQIRFGSATFARARLAGLGLERLERFGKYLAVRKSLAALVVGLSVFVIRGAGALVSGIPLPRYHDEFSYLLAADTFAHGRLTNPTHPMWVHFETFHVIWQPTYASMYPPAHGLMLALGQWLGNAWLGQLLAAALMCSALCWMLQGWVPAKWALLGGLLAAARLGLLSYWTNGYWCGCVPALGGALVLGALPRITQSTRGGMKWSHAAWMGLGLAILADSRPYEGLVLSAAVGLALIVWMVWGRPGLGILLWRVVLPVVLVLAPAAAWTSFYYYRVTGSPVRMAYEINREMYAPARYFVWQHELPQPEYRHPRMGAVYSIELQQFRESKTWMGFLHLSWLKIEYFWRTFLVMPLPLVLVALPWAARDRKTRVPWLIGVAFVAGIAVETWAYPHYWAPAIALLYLLLVQCMRHLRLFYWRGKPAGLALLRAVAVVYVGTVLLRAGLAFLQVHPEHDWQMGDMDRQTIVQQLRAMPGLHVVLVKYAADFDLDREWVYNAADIDGSKIVWARDMGAAANAELLAYYPGRRFWSAYADGSPPRVEEYRAGGP
jgi:hypothetical protein